MEANGLERDAAKSNEGSKFARVGKLWRDERQRTRDQAAKRGSGSSGGSGFDFLSRARPIVLKLSPATTAKTPPRFPSPPLTHLNSTPLLSPTTLTQPPPLHAPLH